MNEADSSSATGAAGLEATRRVVCVAITALLFLSGKCFSDLDYRNLYTDVTPEVVTEHTAWAKPYYRGSLRSLWIIPLPESGSPRLAAEVWQRLSLDYTVCLVYSRDFLGSDTAKDDYTRQIPTTHEEPVRRDLAAKIAGSYEVMVIDDIRWTTFPPEVRQAIVNKVRAGMGLVFTCPPEGNPPPDLQSLLSEKVDIPEVIEASFPTEALSCFRGVSPLVRTFRCGQGRIGVLPPQSTSAPEDPHGIGPVTRWADPIVLNDEYDQARLVRALLWAAHREPEVIVREMKLEAAKVAPYAATLRLRTSSAFEAPRQLTAEIRCRDLRNRTCGASLHSLTLPTGKGNLDLRLATLKPVKQIVDLWLREGNRTVCWGSSYVEVPPEVPIRQVRLTQDCYQKGQTIRGEVVLAGPPASTSLLIVELWDNVERLLGRQQLALMQRRQPVAFKFPARDITTPVAWIRCRIQQGSRLLGWAEQEVMVHQRPPQDDFVLGCSGTQMWNMNILRWHQIAVRRRELSKFGIQYGYLWGGPAAAALFARENQTIIAGLGGRWCDTSGTQKGSRIRRPCLSDPAFRVEARKVAQEEAGRLKVFGPPFYSLAGEFALGRRKDGSPDLCFSPSCLEFFRKYVKEQYGALEALNHEYGTQYQDWSEVKPALYEEAKAAGNFAPYVDHLLAMEAVVADFFDDMARTVRKLDPAAKVGIDSPCPLVFGAGLGPIGVQTGYSYPRFVRIFDGLVNYDFEAEREFIRSQAKHGFYYSEWWGAYLAQRRENHLRFYPWRMLFAGATSSWYFHDVTASENALAYDLRPTDWFLWANEELQEIRSGVGKLILQATPEQDGVAILWSQPCLHARDVEIPETSSWPQNVMCSLLQDVGLSYRFITTDQLRAGVLLKEKYRALALPWAVALDPEEAKQIRAFVAQGGTVFADVRPGVMDAHCKGVATGQLDDVFGVQPRALLRAAVAEHSNADNNLLPCYETSLTPVGAKVQPDSPEGASVLMNRFGRGTTILLNLRMDQYGSTGWGLSAGLRSRGGEGPVRSIIIRLLSERGIASPITLQLSSGPQAGVEIKRYRVGELEYVALLSNSMVPRKDQTATINLLRKAHVYDVRQNRYVGKTSEVKTRLSAGSVRLYALLPYLAKSMKIEAPRRVAQGGTATCGLQLHVQGAAAGRHVFHLEMIDPEGRSAPWFFRNLLAENGACATELRFALNEKAGRWLIKVKDIATGLAAQQDLTIADGSTTENR